MSNLTANPAVVRSPKKRFRRARAAQRFTLVGTKLLVLGEVRERFFIVVVVLIVGVEKRRKEEDEDEESLHDEEDEEDGRSGRLRNS